MSATMHTTPMQPALEEDGRSDPAPLAEASGTLATVDRLLRDRPGILVRILSGDDLAGLARAMIATIMVCGAVFGGAMGAYRGGWQIAFAAIKLPLVILLTAAVCAPALTALNAALDRPATLRRDLALVLCALALGALVLAAETPLVLLAVSQGIAYHTLILLVTAASAVAGLVGLSLLLAGLDEAHSARGRSVALALVGVFVLVGAQMSWTLRPWLVRPRTPDVPFARAVESNLFEAVVSSLQSARGVYRRDAAPLPDDATGAPRPAAAEAQP